MDLRNKKKIKSITIEKEKPLNRLNDGKTDPKGRYEVRGNMMRATYGHTVEIELDLPSTDIPDSLYYPCDPEESGNLLDVGISPGDGSHVHLSASIRATMKVIVLVVEYTLMMVFSCQGRVFALS